MQDNENNEEYVPLRGRFKTRARMEAGGSVLLSGFLDHRRSHRTLDQRTSRTVSSRTVSSGPNSGTGRVLAERKGQTGELWCMAARRTARLRDEGISCSQAGDEQMASRGRPETPQFLCDKSDDQVRDSQATTSFDEPRGLDVFVRPRGRLLRRHLASLLPKIFHSGSGWRSCHAVHIS